MSAAPRCSHLVNSHTSSAKAPPNVHKPLVFWVARGLLAAVLGGGLAGCGAATTKIPGTAAAEVQVNLDGEKPKEDGHGATKGAAEEAKPTPEEARKAGILEALGKLEEAGIVGVLSGTDDVQELSAFAKLVPGGVSGGMVGGVPGGVIGGTIGLGSGGGGFGGLGGVGLSGIGVGGGGRGEGIGLGSIGGLSSGRVSAYSSNTVSGQSVYASGDAVVELGDSGTLGLTLEEATRAIRNHGFGLRDCYADGLEKNGSLAGQMTVRLVVGKDGEIDYVRFVDSAMGDEKVLSCIRKELLGAQVGTPLGGLFGVIETVFRFRPAQKK